MHRRLVVLFAILGMALAMSGSRPATAQTGSADLRLSFSRSGDPISGTEFSYTVEVVNDGPNTAVDTILTFTLPASFTLIAAAGCTGTSALRCDYGAMSNGAIRTSLIRVLPTQFGFFQVTASVVSATSDPDASDNQQQEFTFVDAPPFDISVQRFTASPNPVNAGSELTLDATILNSGPNVAPGVFAFLSLGSGTTIQSATTSAGSCSPGTASVFCDFGDIAVSSTVLVRVRLIPTVIGVQIYSIGLSPSAPDSNPANDQGQTSVTVTDAAPSADVELVGKVASPDPVSSGDQVTYAITVRNNGPDPAEGVTVLDPLPADVTFVDASPSCTYDPATRRVTCNLGTLAAGTTATVSFRATAPVESSGGVRQVSNTATVSAATPDPNGENNAKTITHTVHTGSADMQLVSKVATPDPATVGGTVTYTITARNNGPTVAPGAVIEDSLPAGVVFVSATSSVGQPCAFVAATNNVSCPLGTLAVGQTVTATIQVIADSVGVQTNVASALAQAHDTNFENNDQSVTHTVTAGPADIELVSKTVSLDPAPVNASLVYTLTVRNNGPNPATNVTLTDTLAAALGFAAGATDGRCTFDAPLRRVTCRLGTLAVGQSTTVSIGVTAGTAGAITNEAFVTAAEQDPVPANSSKQLTHTIANTDPRLNLTMVAPLPPLFTDTPLTFTGRVTNLDALAVPNPAIEWDCGADCSVDSFAIAGATCTGTGTPRARCALPSLAASATLDLSAALRFARARQYTVTLRVVVPDDATPGDNEVTETVSVLAPTTPDLAASIVTAPATAQPGARATIAGTVRNLGGASTAPILIDFTCRGQCLIESVTAGGATCTVEPRGNNARCTRVGLPASAVAQFDMDVLFLGRGVAEIAVAAQLGSGPPDSTPANNQAAVSIAVAPAGAPRVDVELVRKSSHTVTVAVGDSVIYGIVIHNRGQEDAVGVTVVDEFDTLVQFVSAEVEEPGRSSGPPCPIPAGPGTSVTCTVGRLRAGQSRVISVVVSAGAPGRLTNTATVFATNDETPNNNQQSLTVTVIDPSTDVDIFDVRGPNRPVPAGQPFEYMVIVRNRGQAAARMVQLEVQPPAGLQVLRAGVDDRRLSGGLRLCNVPCDLGRIAAGGTVRVVVTVVAAAPGSYTTTFRVSAANDANPANNVTTATTTVNGQGSSTTPAVIPPAGGGPTTRRRHTRERGIHRP